MARPFHAHVTEAIGPARRLWRSLPQALQSYPDGPRHLVLRRVSEEHAHQASVPRPLDDPDGVVELLLLAFEPALDLAG